MNPLLLAFAGLVALAVSAAIVALASERGGAKAREIAKRLRHLGLDSDEGHDIAIERDVRYSGLPILDRLLRSLNVGEHLDLQLYQAGMTMRAGVLVGLCAAFTMAGYFAGLILLHRLLPAVVFMLLLGPAPYFYVRVKKAQRMTAFTREFPDALDLLVSALRAGLSFAAAMQIVAEESPEPVRGEFAIAVEEASLGLEMREVLLNLTRRVDVLDLRFFVVAVLLQRETGGNLAEVLANGAALIRDRFRVLGDIATFTAQGKMTAVILVAMPVLVGLFTFTVAPDYFLPMMTTDAGRKALFAAGAMQLAGVLIMHRIVRIRV